jgi:hypothetical protein
LREFGLRYVYEEENFYKMFKLSRKDFVEKLEKADESKREKIIMDIIYKAPKTEFGRRGVLPLS